MCAGHGLGRPVVTHCPDRSAERYENGEESGSVDGSTAFERATQREFVGILEIAANWQAAGDAGDGETKRLEKAGQVHGGGFAFDVGVGAQDDLGDRMVAQPVEEFLDAKLVGTDTIDGIDGTLKHVIAPAVFAGALDGNDVSGFFDDTDDRRVAPVIGTDRTTHFVADVEADLTKPHLRLGLTDGTGETEGVGIRQLDEMKGDALGRLRADAREPAKLVDERLDCRRIDADH